MSSKLVHICVVYIHEICGVVVTLHNNANLDVSNQFTFEHPRPQALSFFVFY